MFKSGFVIVFLFFFAGCSNKWTDAEKYIVKRQADRLAELSGSKNVNAFVECFQSYILENYNGKEYMDSGTSAASLAMIQCKN